MTNGNEALVFANQYAVTSFIFKCGTSIGDTADWSSANIGTPSIQIKQQSLYVNAAIPSGTSPSYNFYVDGSAVATGAVTAGSASDQRLKENIVSMNGADAKSLIMALRPVTYRWNALATSLYDKYEGEDVGFVAQEVQPYMPVAISTIFEKYLRLDQTKFISNLSIISVCFDGNRCAYRSVTSMLS